MDKGIANIADLFNQFYPDGRTAFIFTADHGMSNKGEHDKQNSNNFPCAYQNVVLNC